MERKNFIKTIIGTSAILLIMNGISTLTGTTTLQKSKEINLPYTDEIASFGAVHLNNTSIEKAITFWTKVIGMKLRKQSATEAEFGSESKTLVVVHKAASSPFREGYSGLYHFAIHLPDKQEFAKAIYRLQQSKHSFSPVDHTMTQSIYLHDFDNVMIELALESPERFKRVITVGGLFMEDSDGNIRGASAPLDTDEILKHLVDKDLDKIISNDVKIGHFHFYANTVETNKEFYLKLGFTQSNYFPQYKFADLGTGGPYLHRMALNAWHGDNKPMAPSANAGLRHYHIVFRDKNKLQSAIQSIGNIEEKEGFYLTTDPTGVKIILTHD